MCHIVTRCDAAQLKAKRACALARKTLSTDYSSSLVKDIDLADGEGMRTVYHNVGAIRQTGSQSVALYEMMTTSKVSYRLSSDI